MTSFDISLVAATLFCSLVAGFLFAYAVVIMPGIKSLGDRAYLQAFQSTDRIIQDGHPLFLLVWLGSMLALLICAFLSLETLKGVDFMLLMVATASYVVGVQLTTILVHLPLNNRLKDLDLSILDDDQLKIVRSQFESRWNQSNIIRTAVACAVSLMLIVLAVKV